VPIVGEDSSAGLAAMCHINQNSLCGGFFNGAFDIR
jgi:hypothetical protein